MSSAEQRLAPVDEANLVLDHAGQVNVFLVAGLVESGGFVGPDGTPNLSILRDAVAERIDSLAPLRQVVVRHGRRHHWTHARPDLQEHVRLSPTVDGIPGLQRLCAQLMVTPLDRDRPLWELLVVPGFGARRVAIVLRIHHTVADGMAAVAIAQRLFDPRRNAEVPGSLSTMAPQKTAPEPGRRLRRMLRSLGPGIHRVRLTLTKRQVGSTVLLGERSAHRGVAFIGTDLAHLQARVHAVGATVNDALLACVASGFRAALRAAAEPVPALLPVSVPVALRRQGTSRNQVGVMLIQLPLGEESPDVRLRLIAEQTRVAKRDAREQGTLELMRGPVGARLMDRVGRRQHLVAGFVTDVPGPPQALFLAGAAVSAIWPVAVLAGNVRLGVAATSYAGRLACSVHFDAANVPGDTFAEAMQTELTRLSG